MRPDRLTAALNSFIAQRMGDKYIDVIPFKI